MAAEAKAFAGVRILDFTHYLAGPFCTFQLAMQGAEVIKVEPREGDSMRVATTSKEWAEHQLAPAWMAVNANKRSITLDLTKPEAIAVIHKLVQEVDVVCENFRPGVMDKLGIGYAALSALNPRLIYCGISGFGNTGPERRTASFDGKIQAMSGLMTLTGLPENGPMRAGFALADITTGMSAAFALASALFQRTHTGRGQFVDVSMLESMLNFMGGQVAEYSMLGQVHAQNGNLSISRKPTADRFACGTGYLVLAVLTDKQFETLMRTLGQAEALEEARFANWEGRTEHNAALRELIETAMKDGDPKQWEERLTQADVPCASVYSIAEIVAHPQVAARELMREVPSAFGPVKLLGSAFKLAHGNGGFERVIAQPGADNDAVLAELGYQAQAIAQLRLNQVI